jgi:hypothetical protein
MREYTIDYKYVISFNVVEESEEDKGVWLCDFLEADVIYLQEETSE